MRAAGDPVHSAMLEKMRTEPGVGETYVPYDQILKLKTLKSTDMESNNSPWSFAPVIVTNNSERMSINAFQVKRWSRMHNVPHITWHEPMVGPVASLLSPRVKERLCTRSPELRGHFVKGASGYLTNNINPGKIKFY